MEIIKTQLKINGELKNVEIENGEITIIEPVKIITGWEKVEYGQTYYCDFSGVVYDTNHKDTTCKEYRLRYNNANYFSNMKLADNISRMQMLQRKMFRWQAENDIPIISNSKYKWCILYNPEVNPNIHVNIKISNEGFLPYFSSKEKALECIKIFKDDLIWLFTEFQWRIDCDKNSISCKESSVNQND